MSSAQYLFVVLCLSLFSRTSSTNTSACIPNTPCQCLLTKHSFVLNSCSHSLPNIPILHPNISININRIIAWKAFVRWPLNICRYSQLQILDLSGSYLQSEDVSCLSQLTQLNLSDTQLRKIPNFQQSRLEHLKILDLSKNRIEFLDGAHFRSLQSLITLFLQNNPLKHIESLEYILHLPHLQLLNLISTNFTLTISKPITTIHWTQLAHQWNETKTSFVLHSNTIPFQSLFPTLSLDLMRILLDKFSNSTFITSLATPECNCTHLRYYQRLFFFLDNDKDLAPLFQSSTCLMPNGIIHARLFDRRIYTQLNCSIQGMKRSSPILLSSASFANIHLWILSFGISLFLFYQ